MPMLLLILLFDPAADVVAAVYVVVLRESLTISAWCTSSSQVNIYGRKSESTFAQTTYTQMWSDLFLIVLIFCISPLYKITCPNITTQTDSQVQGDQIAILCYIIDILAINWKKLAIRNSEILPKSIIHIFAKVGSNFCQIKSVDNIGSGALRYYLRYLNIRRSKIESRWSHTAVLVLAIVYKMADLHMQHLTHAAATESRCCTLEICLTL